VLLLSLVFQSLLAHEHSEHALAHAQRQRQVIADPSLASFTSSNELGLAGGAL
jgi:hypothetical protein